ncbi:MAG: hypothetical protein ACRC4N_18355 [Gammaproteobacteria bacterium]
MCANWCKKRKTDGTKKVQKKLIQTHQTVQKKVQKKTNTNTPDGTKKKKRGGV